MHRERRKFNRRFQTCPGGGGGHARGAHTHTHAHTHAHTHLRAPMRTRTHTCWRRSRDHSRPEVAATSAGSSTPVLRRIHSRPLTVSSVIVSSSKTVNMCSCSSASADLTSVATVGWVVAWPRARTSATTKECSTKGGREARRTQHNWHHYISGEYGQRWGGTLPILRKEVGTRPRSPLGRTAFIQLRFSE